MFIIYNNIRVRWPREMFIHLRGDVHMKKIEVYEAQSSSTLSSSEAGFTVQGPDHCFIVLTRAC